jgi:chemotaxis methyl-accepting protein methylase
MSAAAAVSAVEPAPIRLRATTAASIGTTAFFRNRALLNVLLGRMAILPSNTVSVLVHACSIGAEVWSLAIAAELDPRLRNMQVQIAACDLESAFVAHAERGIYSRAVLSGMRPAEQSYFEPLDSDSVRVCDRLRARVRFLPAQSAAGFECERAFDVVLLLNVLLYMPAELQSLTIDRIARYNRSLLVTTGFHLERIKSDMQRNGYRPVNEDLHAIHDGWTDRRRNGPPREETVPGKIYHAWSLPPFSEIDEFEYKYCAVFERTQPTQT